LDKTSIEKASVERSSTAIFGPRIFLWGRLHLVLE